MRFRSHSEDEYLAHIDSLRDELLDPVASFEEWDRFKRALVRWMAQVDGEMDEGGRSADRQREPRHRSRAWGLMVRIWLGRVGYRLMGWGMHKDGSRRFRWGARLQAWAAGTAPWNDERPG